jgi:hypothetical protein
MAEVFALFWKAFFDSALEHLPEIAIAWREATTTTAADAAVPPQQQAVEAAAEQMPK